ncbi:MAG: hypothetical protein PWQ70_2631 [Clostridiales bacterium]|nr:hypothetical protein [Clostridiales bacterium]
MNKHKSFLKILLKIEEIFLMVCLGVMAVVLLVQVISRYCFGFPLIWSEELARYLLIWVTFIGLGYGIRQKCHIEMEYFYNRMPQTVQNVMSILTNLFMTFCFIYFIPGALRFLMDQNTINSSAMGIKMSLVYFFIPVSTLIAACYLSVDTYFRLKSLIGVKKGGDIEC